VYGVKTSFRGEELKEADMVFKDVEEIIGYFKKLA